VRPLNRAGIRYGVTGGVAAIFYGEPRLTHEVHVVGFLRPHDLHQRSEVFPQADSYLPPRENLLAELAREHSGHFHLLHLDTGFKADLYPTGRDEVNAWAFRGQRTIESERRQEDSTISDYHCTVTRLAA
jgi:hypothetical protein